MNIIKRLRDIGVTHVMLTMTPDSVDEIIVSFCYNGRMRVVSVSEFSAIEEAIRCLIL